MTNEKNIEEVLLEQITQLYGLAAQARAKHLDPSEEVEARPAGGLADRVEGLVGPPGVAKMIIELREKTDNLVPTLIDELLKGKTYQNLKERERDADQIVRTSLAVLTEGVVAAPIEGISDVTIRTNPDGSEYLSIFFSGPIRSAGGTAQGLAVLVGDYVRRKLGLSEYRPTKDELERYVEEIKLYDERVTRLQYTPTDDDVRTIVERCAVCIDGDPTESLEVAIHRDLERTASNRVRGGMCLVIAEGMAQKARKLMKKAEKFSIDWNWLDTLSKGSDKKDTDKPKAKFMDEVVGGRPIFSAPSAKGGLRLCYGHSRANSIAAKSIHPATMILLDDFIATGTQVKVEKPGKGCIITECDTIDGPMVRLKSGDFLRCETREMAKKMLPDVEEITFLGDLLVTYGDFLQTNTTLVPSPYVTKWWMLEKQGLRQKLTPDESVEYCKTNGVPLHPRYTYFWSDIDVSQIKSLAKWFCEGVVEGVLNLDYDIKNKRILEFAGIPHRVSDKKILIDEHVPLCAQLGIETLDLEGFEKKTEGLSDDMEGFEFVKKTSSIELKNTGGTYIGCRMGRPEKSKERRMQPAVHGLFPIGSAGGRERSVNEAADKNRVEVEISQFYCRTCEDKIHTPYCPSCFEKANPLRTCKCGYQGNLDTCPKCASKTIGFAKTNIDLKRMWAEAIRKIGRSTKVKGVIGMISESKIPEPLEKGLLRAINDVYVFKDGTIRFDATDAPLSHFKPKEIGLSLEKVRMLGYTFDNDGAPITDTNQVIELFTQDIIVSGNCGDYLLRVSRFVDQLMQKFYGLDAVYNLTHKDELIGHLIVGLAPHTSAGVVGRIIGYTDANVCFAHPFWHAAKRRNADGDEDSIMLMMDMLLNFSKNFLPQKRGGKMDAPLVVTKILDPKEVDDEAHKVEVVNSYTKEFYERTQDRINPSEIKVKTTKDILDVRPFTGFGYTHDTGDITGPVVKSRYVTLDSMRDKIKAQLQVAEKIRAIDERRVAEIVINSHFLRDTYGNLRAFSRQKFRCVKCNESFRRIPLTGKCSACGGKLLLTVSQGNITKYLGMSQDMAIKYQLSDYLKSRLDLLSRDVESLTTNDLKKQVSLADFM